jgi:type II secretory pathway pseudopilin PulG
MLQSARRSAGVSLVELLAVLALAGIVLVTGAVGWQRVQGRTATQSAARLTRALIHQARMNAIYRGVNHYVVVDPVNKRLELYADTGSSPRSFDSADPWVAGTHFDATIELALPASAIVSPLDATAVVGAWSLPEPDSSARWGSSLKGLMATPTGVIQSVESTPRPIGNGLIVFSDGKENVTAVGIRGRSGTVQAFELFGGEWRER